LVRTAHISGGKSGSKALSCRHQACDDDYSAVGHDPSAQLHVQLDTVRRGQRDLGSEQCQPGHKNDGMQMDKRRNVDRALEGGAEISGPEANQGGDDYENRRWQIEAPTYPTHTPKITLLRTL